MELQRHFEQLSTSTSWQSPLAVVAHVDLDAFYAQVQGVYANIDPAEPLCCRQWGSVIAVNYPARKCGIKRGMNISEVKKLCPGVHLPHVATFKKGDTTWKMRDEPEMESHKVSLDLFRSESRKIFAIFKDECPVVEKAGIDEGFIDLGPQVYQVAKARFPELSSNDPQSKLPPVPESVDIEQYGLCFADKTPSTWHDILILLGNKIVYDLRQKVYEKLKYTCSAGIASSKVIAKLGSGCNKPFNQTVVTNSHIPEFLDKFKLGDAWGWGGKLGDEVTQLLSLPDDHQFSYIRDLSFDQLKSKLKDEKLASALHKLCRGSLTSEITKRTTIKSMASVKQFRAGVKTEQDVKDWLKVYSSDISGRLHDLAVDNNGLEFRPKSLTLKWAKNENNKSKRVHGETLMAVPQEKLSEAIYNLVVPIAVSLNLVGTTLLALDASNFEELPKERKLFESLFVDDGKDESLKYWCDECRRKVADEQEHKDWHFAKQLQAQQTPRPVSFSSPASPSKRGVKRNAAGDPKQGKISDFFK